MCFILKVMDHKATDQFQLKVEPTPTFEELAKSQGVEPVLNFEELLGTPSPEDESVEEFANMLRQWRSEGSRSSRQQ